MLCLFFFSLMKTGPSTRRHTSSPSWMLITQITRRLSMNIFYGKETSEGKSLTKERSSNKLGLIELKMNLSV